MVLLTDDIDEHFTITNCLIMHARDPRGFSRGLCSTYLVVKCNNIHKSKYHFLPQHRPRETPTRSVVDLSEFASAFARFHLRSLSVEFRLRLPAKHNKFRGFILTAERMTLIYQRSKLSTWKTLDIIDNTAASLSRFCFIIKLQYPVSEITESKQLLNITTLAIDF